MTIRISRSSFLLHLFDRHYRKYPLETCVTDNSVTSFRLSFIQFFNNSNLFSSALLFQFLLEILQICIHFMHVSFL